MTDTSDSSGSVWPSPAGREQARRQARDLRDQAHEGGLRFQAYLPPKLALWLLEHIENGTFHDPSEAVFVLFKEAMELEPHADLRRELLKRMILHAADDPRPASPAEEVMARFDARRKLPQPEPAEWKSPKGG